jgi:hypothetical protein
MGKVVRKTNWRVVVEPDDKYSHSWWKDRHYEAACEEILKQVKRHVDDAQHARIESDSVEACEFCSYEWETEEDGTPVCCGKAQEEFKASKAVAP